MKKNHASIASIGGASAIALAFLAGVHGASAQSAAQQDIYQPNVVTTTTTSSGSTSAQSSSGQIGYVGRASADLNGLLTGENLGKGSTGQLVANLQGLLIELGYLQIDPSVPLGYFGPMTEDALAKFQAETLQVPETGYFGPMSKTALAAWAALPSNPLLPIWGRSGQQSQTPSQTSGNSNGTAPAGATGYWYQGNWYGSVPMSTTTASSISGYWLNGTWYPSSTVNNSGGSVGTGYWLNGTWYPVDTSAPGTFGYYSSMDSNASTASQTQGQGVSGMPQGTTGYWYHDTWYNNIPMDPNVVAGIDGYWLNGTWTPIVRNSNNYNQSTSNGTSQTTTRVQYQGQSNGQVQASNGQTISVY